MTIGSLPSVSQIFEHVLVAPPQFSARNLARGFVHWWHHVRYWRPGLPLPKCETLDVFPLPPHSTALESNNLNSPHMPQLWLKGVSTTSQVRALATHKTIVPAEGEEPEPPVILPQHSQSYYLADHLEVPTGELVFRRLDFSINGPIPLRWVCYFRSGSEEDFGLGKGWFHPLCERLWVRPTPDGGNNIELLNQDGRYIQFAQPQIGEACVNCNEGMVLERHGNMSYRLIRPEQPDRIFRSDGANAYLPLVEIRDNADNTLSVDYRNGLPSKLVCSWGRVIEFSCNEQCIERIGVADPKLPALAIYAFSDGQTTKVQNQYAQEERYTYEDGVLTTRLDYAGVPFSFRKCVKTGRYDSVIKGDQAFTLKWRASLHLGEIVDGAGATIVAEFDSANRMTRLCDAEKHVQHWFYDTYGNLCSYTNAEGDRFYYRWDRFRRCVRTTNALGVNTYYRYSEEGGLLLVESAGIQRWQREYNACGQLVAEQDPNGQLWQYHYNEKHQLEMLQDPEEGKTRLSWNSLGELEYITTPEGKNTKLEYDSGGRLLSVARGKETLLAYDYDEHNRLSSVTLQGGETWALHYDEKGRINTLEVVDGFAIKARYNDFGQLEAMATNTGFERQYQFQQGLVTAVISREGSEKRRYNRNGWLTGKIDPRGREQQFEYDAVGRLIQLRDMASITYIERDKLGNITKVSNNSGEDRHYHYDELARLVLADNRYSALRFQYDLCGKITAEHHDNEGTGSHSFTYHYDKRGWKIKCSTENHLVSYLHTPDGNLRGVDINGQSGLRCDYDSEGRVVECVQGDVKTRYAWSGTNLTHFYCSKQNTENEKTLFEQEFSSATFDALRRTLGFTANRGTVSEGEMDNRGNVLQEPGSDGKCYYHMNGWNKLTSAESDEFKTYYRYDPFGRRVSKLITHRKTKHSRQTSFRWQNGNLWSEQHTGPKGTDTLHYLHHPHTGSVTVMLKEEKPFYYISNSDQQPLVIFTANGEIAWHARYDNNGQYTGLFAKPTVSSPWRGFNYYYDSETQLYCNGQHYYSSRLGRWLNGEYPG